MVFLVEVHVAMGSSMCFPWPFLDFVLFLQGGGGGLGGIKISSRGNSMHAESNMLILPGS